MMRLSKYLAHAGLGARRKMEEFIAQGMVTVNGMTVTEQGTKVDPEKDIITCNNKEVHIHKRDPVYYLINKPTGYLCTTALFEKRKKVTDLLPIEDVTQDRLCIVGRLDKNSEGLVLITNDGDLANKMMHPSYEKEKEYTVHVRGSITDEALDQLRNGVDIVADEVPHHTAPAKVYLKERDKISKIAIILGEGKKRQIRLMCDAVGFPVTYLRRVRIGSLRLNGIPRGTYRKLTKDEYTQLRKEIL